MSDQLEIRKANLRDIPSILRLYGSDGLKDKEILSVEEATQIFNKCLKYPNYSIYVATIDEKVVGTFELLIMDNLAHHGSPSGIVEDVVVDINYRSLGIGKKMMEFAMEICKQFGCYKLSLSSNLKREAAHRFYENLGFKKHGFSFLIEL
jgi:ribosomal protein S18 acetylase RimI-like enzyme